MFDNRNPPVSSAEQVQEQEQEQELELELELEQEQEQGALGNWLWFTSQPTNRPLELVTVLGVWLLSIPTLPARNHHCAPE